MACSAVNEIVNAPQLHCLLQVLAGAVQAEQPPRSLGCQGINLRMQIVGGTLIFCVSHACGSQPPRLLQVVENAVRAVGHLRGLGCKDIEFSPEDAGRSDPKFLYRVLAAVIQAGATTVNIPDTTGAQALAAL